ncbi:MAG: ABC transporter permease [Candidatus Obscuribacterales bacterium]|nr:ABC transporter permease [Candidatus Obscuribacterales bacterium]
MKTLFLAELKRRWSMVKAYPAEEIVEVIVLAVFFYMLFLGAKFMAGPTANFGERLDAIVVGYAVWLLMTQTYGGISSALYSESVSGTVEQLMMSPHRLTRIFFARTMADVVFSLLVTSAVACLIMILTGSRLLVSPLMVVPVLGVVLASTGLGFIVGSLVFVFKQVRTVQMVIQFALLFGVMVPIETWSKGMGLLGSLLPISPGAASLRILLVSGQFDLLYAALALANGLVYLVAGMMLFGKMEARAKRRGMVGHY